MTMKFFLLIGFPVLMYVTIACTNEEHDVRAPRASEPAGIENPLLPEEAGSPVCCPLPRDANIVGDVWIGGNLTVVGSIFGPIVPTNPLILQPSSGNQFCIIYKQSDSFEKARLCSSAVASDKGLFISVDGGVTQNFRVNNTGGVQIAAPPSGVALDVTGNAAASAVSITGNGTTTAPALTLINNPVSSSTDFFLTIKNSGVVTQSATTIDNFIVNGCQPGPLSIGTSNATSLIFATNGCGNNRLTINSSGAVTIAAPSSGVGLTIAGGGETITAGDLLISAGNLTLPIATAGAATSATNGLIQLGGANPSTTNISLFEVGTRNFFIGNYATVPNVSGTDNIAIGTEANSPLTTAIGTVCIGANTQATATDSVVIGNTVTSSTARTISIGSKDSTSSGLAPVASAVNAIAIGSASGANDAPKATGISAVAIGGADGASFAGAVASGNRSIAVGVNASSSASNGIAIGSTSGTVGGVGPVASNTNSIAIGSANATMSGPIASGVSAVAMGSADSLGTFDGALASGDRSVAIGINATAQSSGTIALGSASGTAGGNAPIASNISAIAIGSASLTRAGAIASGISSIAIGGADGTSAAVSNFPGAVASGDRSIAIGVNATANAAQTIAIGSVASALSVAAIATNTNAIAIGSASGAIAGASASGVAAIAIGGANGSTPGASASGARSVAIGNGASTSQNDAIVLGNSSVTAVRVGIGISLPLAKLHVVGVNGTSVLRIDQVNSAIGNAPVWLNPSVSAVAGTPIHYNGSNQLFGFTSSIRYKTNIRPIEDESEIIYQLSPVLYDPKEGYGEGKDIAGFIAEEVYLVAPSLVVLDNEAQPENVTYNSLHALAIRELQKQKDRLNQQASLISEHETTINNLLAVIAQLQSCITSLQQA